jgi:hypothetical protein
MVEVVAVPAVGASDGVAAAAVPAVVMSAAPLITTVAPMVATLILKPDIVTFRSSSNEATSADDGCSEGARHGDPPEPSQPTGRALGRYFLCRFSADSSSLHMLIR